MEATFKQKDFLARLRTKAGIPSTVEDFEGLDSVKAHIWINDLLKSPAQEKKKDFSKYFDLERKLKAAGYEFERSELVQIFTGDEQKDGLRKLETWEYEGLLKHMSELLRKLEDPALSRMRRKVISLMRKMGYEILTPEPKADMKAIYTWVKRSGKFKKPLNDHDKDELQQLTTQVELMYDKHLKAVHS